MRASIYNNPLFADGLAGIIEGYIGNPDRERAIARDELDMQRGQLDLESARLRNDALRQQMALRGAAGGGGGGGAAAAATTGPSVGDIMARYMQPGQPGATQGASPYSIGTPVTGDFIAPSQPLSFGEAVPAAEIPAGSPMAAPGGALRANFGSPSAPMTMPSDMRSVEAGLLRQMEPDAISGAMMPPDPAPQGRPLSETLLSFGELASAPQMSAAPMGQADAYEEALARWQAASIDPNLPSDPETMRYLDRLWEYAQSLKPPEVAAADDPTATEEKIALLSEIGFDRQGAIETLLLNDVQRDPFTGELFIINRATGQRVGQPQSSGVSAVPPAADVPAAAAPPMPGVSAAPPPATAAEMPLSSAFTFGFEDSPNAFGIEGTARRFANFAGDVVPGLNPPFPTTLQTQADFELLRETGLSRIAEGYGRQPPSWLLQEIRGLMPQPGVPWEGPERAQTKLRSILAQVQMDLAQTERNLQYRQSPETRAQMEAMVNGHRTTLALFGDVLQSFDRGGAPVAISPEVEERLRAYE
jgi:hypothetical protein